MDIPALDVAHFYQKYQQIPDTERVALWTFDIDGRTISFWGTLAEASSTANLYLRLHDLENIVLILLDYDPMPRVFNVPGFEN